MSARSADAEQHGLEGVEELAERQHGDRRPDEEQRQLASVDLLRAGERRAAVAAGSTPPTHEQRGEDEQRGEQVLDERPVRQIERVQAEQEVGADEHRQGPVPRSVERLVVRSLDEVGQAAHDEPSFDLDERVVGAVADRVRDGDVVRSRIHRSDGS